MASAISRVKSDTYLGRALRGMDLHFNDAEATRFSAREPTYLNGDDLGGWVLETDLGTRYWFVSDAATPEEAEADFINRALE